jgi:hypothetical protein
MQRAAPGQAQYFRLPTCADSAVDVIQFGWLRARKWLRPRPRKTALDAGTLEMRVFSPRARNTMSRERKRRSKRTPTKLPVLFTRNSSCIASTVTRVNRDGLFMRTLATADVGSMIEINAPLPLGQELKLTAAVRFAGGGPDGIGLGVEFQDMDPDTRDLWVEYYRQVLATNHSGHQSWVQALWNRMRRR